MKLVDSRLAPLFAAEQAALSSLQALLERTEAEPAVIDQLRDIVEHLESLFLVVIVGEFNAGKSSVVNALFGETLMEEGPIPTTAKITVLRHGDAPLERQLSEFLVEKRLPAELLKTLSLVDTPGTNSIVTQHQEITERFVPRADLVLFITSFDRPLSESERQFLHYLREAWGKRLVFVVNKIDMAQDDEMLTKVIAHVRSGCQELMQFEPPIYPVSARQAFASKTTEDKAEAESLWKASRFDAFQKFVTNTLNDKERLALKLNAPLDAADRLLRGLKERLEKREAVLEQDEKNLNALDEHLEAARNELRQGYVRYVTEVDNLLLQMEQRGSQFLDDTIRIGKIKMLRDRDQFKEEFARQVVRDTDKKIEEQVTDAVDNLLKSALTLWNKIVADFADRVRTVADVKGQQERGDFFYNRSEIFNAIMKEADRKIELYDLREEARRIMENARGAAALFVGSEAVAMSIGAVATVVVTATAVDVTGGFIAAGVIALAGLIFLPRQKRKAIAEFRERVGKLREDMKRTLSEQLQSEVDGSLGRVKDTVGPYIDFVEEERQTVDAITAEQQAIGKALNQIKADVHQKVGTAGIGA